MTETLSGNPRAEKDLGAGKPETLKPQSIRLAYSHPTILQRAVNPKP